jgi:protein phosphatase 2C family protein 2/3
MPGRLSVSRTFGDV